MAKDVDPILRDGLVSLFSSQKFETVSETAGREKLQADALAEVRKVVAKRLGRPGIDALYFTPPFRRASRKRRGPAKPMQAIECKSIFAMACGLLQNHPKRRQRQP